jgi:hypothetical protein
METLTSCISRMQNMQVILDLAIHRPVASEGMVLFDHAAER